MIEKNPYHLTLKDWSELTLVERRAVRMAAHSLGLPTLKKEFALGNNYVVLCQALDCSTIASKDTPDDFKKVLELAAERDAVPYEFHSPTHSNDALLRFDKYSMALCRVRACPRSGTEGAD